MKNPHTELVNDILVEASKLKDCRVWKSPSFVIDGFRAGVPGMPDIMGLVKVKTLSCYYGQAIGIEVKTGSGVLSKEQKLFHAMFLSLGGKICVARSIEDALTFVKALTSA